MGARLVPMHVRAHELNVTVQEGAAKIARLTGSASIREERLRVTLNNPSVDSPVTTRLRFAGGARASQGRGMALDRGDRRAGGTFQDTDEARPGQLAIAGCACCRNRRRLWPKRGGYRSWERGSVRRRQTEAQRQSAPPASKGQKQAARSCGLCGKSVKLTKTEW